MHFEDLRKTVEDQIVKMRLEAKEKNKKEKTFMWHDARKKLPELDQLCLVSYIDEEGEEFIQRARFINGLFISCENTSGFPLLIQKWFAIPEDDQE
jgi:hypothetical protein